MATIISKFDTFEYDPKKAGVPVEQIFIELSVGGTRLNLPITDLVYWDGLSMKKVDSYDVFSREFEDGGLSYSGFNIPPKRIYNPDEIRIYYTTPNKNETAKEITVYDPSAFNISVGTTTKIKPTIYGYGNNRSVVMSKIDADFLSRRLPSGTVIDQAQIDKVRSNIPLGDRYLLVLLDGDQNPQYIKASEIVAQYSLDGNNWTNFEPIDLDGPRALELFRRLSSGQAKLSYNGRLINEINSDNNVLTEYVPDSVVREELIDYDTNRIMTVNPSAPKEEYLISEAPLSMAYSIFTPATRSVDDEKNEGKKKTEHVYEIETYNVDNKNGDLVKVTLLGESIPTFVATASLFIKRGDSFTPIEITGNVHEALLSYVGQDLYVEQNGQMRQVEPLTQMSTVTYEALKTFQPTPAGMNDDTYLLLENGEYIKETSAVQPIAYVYKPNNGKADAYLIERNGETYIIDATLYEASKTAPSIKAKAYDGREIEIPIDANTKITELMRARDIRNCDVIQTTSTHSRIESARVLDRTNNEVLNIQINECREDFLKVYKNGDYSLDSVYDNKGRLVKVDTSNGERYALSTIRTERDYALDTLEYKGLSEKPLVFKVKGDNIEEVKVKGGPKFDVAKANAKGLKTYGKALGTVAQLALTPAGLLVSIALPFVVGAVAASAVIAPIAILTRNAIKGMEMTGKKHEFKDKFLIQREKIAKDVESTLRDLYEQCAEVEKEKQPTSIAKYMKEYERVYARIMSLGPASCKVDISVEKDGSIICTSENAHLLSVFRTKYKKKLVELNKVSTKRESLKQELKSLQESAKKYTKRAIANTVPKELQDRITAITREIALCDQHYETAKKELDDKYSLLAQDEYKAADNQQKLLDRAECFKLISIIRLSTREQLLELGLTADQVALLKNAKININKMTIKDKIEMSILDLMAGNSGKKLQWGPEQQIFNRFRNAIDVLMNANAVKSNGATVIAPTRNIEEPVEVETKTFELDENLVKLENTSRSVEHQLSRLDRLTTKYRDLTRLVELESLTSTFDPNTKKISQLKLIQEMSALRKKYSVNKKTSSVEARIEKLKEEIANLKIDISRLEQAQDRLTQKKGELQDRKEDLDSRLTDSEEEKANYSSLQARIQTFRKQFMEIDRKLSSTADPNEISNLTAKKKEVLKNINIMADAISTVTFVYDTIRQLHVKNDEMFVRIQNINIDLDDKSLISLEMAGSLTDEKKQLQNQVRSNKATIKRLKKLVESIVTEADIVEVKKIIEDNAKTLKDTLGFGYQQANIEEKRIGKKNDPSYAKVDELSSRMSAIEISDKKDKDASNEYEAKIHFFNEKIVEIDVRIGNLMKTITDKNTELQVLIDELNEGQDVSKVRIVGAIDLLKETQTELNDQLQDLDEIEGELKMRRTEFDNFVNTHNVSAKDKQKFDDKYDTLIKKIARIRLKSKQLDQKIAERSREVNREFTTKELEKIAKSLVEFTTYLDAELTSGKTIDELVKDAKLIDLSNELQPGRLKALLGKKDSVKVKGIDPLALKDMIKKVNQYREKQIELDLNNPNSKINP